MVFCANIRPVKFLMSNGDSQITYVPSTVKVDALKQSENVPKVKQVMQNVLLYRTK